MGQLLTLYNGGICIEELREYFWACAHGKMSKQRGVQKTNIINTATFLTSCIMKENNLRESEHKYPIEIGKT